MTSVIDTLRAIVVEQLGVEDWEVTPIATFNEDLGCDSLDHIEILMACEQEFDLDIPDEDGEKLRTVGEAVAYLEARLLKLQTPRVPA